LVVVVAVQGLTAQAALVAWEVEALAQSITVLLQLREQQIQAAAAAATQATAQLLLEPTAALAALLFATQFEGQTHGSLC
jgi:hypothetical protein